jgi:tRNA-Thr(GGU) m(6)t(6)A37 methyltransferase TsaA
MIYKRKGSGSMANGFSVKFIAHIRSDFQTKFGIPRQSGLVEELESRVVFTPEYRNPDALRGLEGFSHLWLIWQFSGTVRSEWSPTVRPPRLGGNVRMGVFATRSPFRPNPIGLSCVKLLGVEEDRELGTILRVAGADLMDGTPILDIKPYVPYVDAHPEAKGGFAPAAPERRLTVDCPAELLEVLPEGSRAALLGVLAEDPRPAYQDDPSRVYGFGFAGAEVKFSVAGQQLTVLSVTKN